MKLLGTHHVTAEETSLLAETLAELVRQPGGPEQTAATTIPTHWEDATEVELGHSEQVLPGEAQRSLPT